MTLPASGSTNPLILLGPSFPRIAWGKRERSGITLWKGISLSLFSFSLLKTPHFCIGGRHPIRGPPRFYLLPVDSLATIADSLLIADVPVVMLMRIKTIGRSAKEITLKEIARLNGKVVVLKH